MNVDSKFLGLGYLDILSFQDTPVHRLDPRAKVLTTIVFIVAVVSFDKYQVSALLPFAIFPVIMIVRGNLPAAYLMGRLLFVLPFAFFVGMFNPLLDRDILFRVGSAAVSGGWISFFSILLRFVLTVLAALTLIATTGFIGVCTALEMLGLPRVFAVQLLFLYRYLFVLAAEGGRMARARSLRSFGDRGMGVKVFSSLVGHLLLRTIDRAQRIYMAMLSRGFHGEFHFRRPFKMGFPEIAFIFGWSALFILFRVYNLPRLLGGILTGVAP
ncbi:MAG: cobalt/nickel transport system permease [Geobacteraceae bacterium]|nr:MAG: cobalt/nickel transport system permease [Geobacteraceae bacterium]